MNFQPPRPAKQRKYIDGISVIKSSAVPLQPVPRMAVAVGYEPVLAHRVIHVPSANRLGLPVARTGIASLAHMRKLTTTSRPAAASTAMAIKQGVSHARERMYAVGTAVRGGNWLALLPGRYKKYTARHGVTVNRSFKGQGTTALVALMVLVTVGLWPGAAAPSQSSPISAADTAKTVAIAANQPVTGTATPAQTYTANADPAAWPLASAASQSPIASIPIDGEQPSTPSAAPQTTTASASTPTPVTQSPAPSSPSASPSQPVVEPDDTSANPADPAPQQPAPEQPTPEPTVPSGSETGSGGSTGGSGGSGASVEVGADLPLIGETSLGLGLGL